MRVSVITTTRHNVGDDFVRDGLLHLIEQVIGPVREKHIHKHLPITARPEFDWYHLGGVARLLDRLDPRLGLRGSRGLDLLPLFPWSDRVLNCDVLIQSGAPVYWSTPDGDCQNNEWWRPLIERRWVPRANGRPFISLAGGTCQHFHSDGSEFAGRTAVLDYVRRFYDLTTLTTVRDELSVEVLRLAGRTAEALPCTSIFAVDRLGIRPRPGEYVALNYMSGGGHFEFGQPIDKAAWERRFTTFVRNLSKREKCVLACHNAKELADARRILPEVPVFFSGDYRSFLEFYAGAKFGVMNRVHGAFALASLGKPAMVIGADSRARMAEMIGLGCSFVNDATEEWLEHQAGVAARRVEDYPAEIAERKTRAKGRYVAALGPALGRE